MMTRPTVAVLLIAAILAAAHTCIAIEEDTAEFNDTFYDCIANEAVDLNAMNLYPDAADDPTKANRDSRCFAKCLLEGFGMLKDGRLDKDAFVEKYGGEDRAKQAYESCKDEGGDEECETEYNFFMCAYKKAKE